MHGYKIQQSSDSKASQHQCPTDLGMAQGFVTTYVTKFSVCKLHAWLQYFNSLPISKLPNTNGQPDLGSVVCDQVTEYSVDKLHGYKIQQSLDSIVSQHQRPTDLGIAQWFVTKLLSSQSANCMVTKFNNP